MQIKNGSKNHLAGEVLSLKEYFFQEAVELIFTGVFH